MAAGIGPDEAGGGRLAVVEDMAFKGEEKVKWEEQMGVGGKGGGKRERKRR